MLKFARIHIFYKMMKPFSKRMRERRSIQFLNTIRPTPGMRVLDLGGSPDIWASIPVPLNITLLNLERSTGYAEAAAAARQHTFTFTNPDHASDLSKTRLAVAQGAEIA